MLLSPLHRPLSPLRSPQQPPSDGRKPVAAASSSALASSTPTSPTSSRRSKKRPLDPSVWLVGFDSPTRAMVPLSREMDEAPHVAPFQRRPCPSDPSVALVASGLVAADGGKAMRDDQQQQQQQGHWQPPTSPSALTPSTPTVVVLGPDGGRLPLAEDEPNADGRRSPIWEPMDEDDATVPAAAAADPQQQDPLAGGRELYASRVLSAHACWAAAHAGEGGEGAMDLRSSVRSSGQIRISSGSSSAAGRPARGGTNKRSRSPSPTPTSSSPRAHRFRRSASSTSSTSSRTTPPAGGDLSQARPPAAPAVFLSTCTPALPLAADSGLLCPSPLVDDGNDDDDVEMTLPADEHTGDQSEVYASGSQATVQNEAVGAHTSVGWRRRRTAPAAPIDPAKIAHPPSDDDDRMADGKDTDSTPSPQPPPSALASSYPKAASRLQSLSHGLAALRTDRSSAGSSFSLTSSASSAGPDIGDGSALSPFPLTPGLYEPGTRGRERMAALMGLLPSPPSQRGSTSRWSGSTTPTATPAPPPDLVVGRTLDSPFRGRRPAVDSASLGRPQSQDANHLLHEPSLSRSLPTSSKISELGDVASDLVTHGSDTALGSQSVSPASRLSLRQRPNGRFVVDYVGPRDEQPW